MKKLFKLIAILLSIATLTFIGCKPSANSSTGENNNETQTPTYTFVAPDGAPALSIAKFIADNELIEVTPKSIRLRKVILDTPTRKKAQAAKKRMQ